jgi:hypothetical protein
MPARTHRASTGLGSRGTNRQRPARPHGAARTGQRGWEPQPVITGTSWGPFALVGVVGPIETSTFRLKGVDVTRTKRAHLKVCGCTEPGRCRDKYRTRKGATRRAPTPPGFFSLTLNPYLEITHADARCTL